MAGRRVTLADVARAAAVSSTTASLVLSGRGGELRISEAVQERVRSAAAALGYRPNIVSRGLRQGSSRSIGLVSDTVATSQLAGDMIKGALGEARAAEYTLIIGETEGDPAVERRLLESMHDRQVDGILLASMYTRTREVPEALDDVPTVLLNTLPAGDGPRLPAVVPDELEAGRAAARLLLETGHRAIHLIGAGPGLHDVPPGTVAGDERLAGILEVLGAAGVAPASGRVCYEWLPPDGYRATRAILERAGPHDPGTALAILTFNDRLAFGAYQAIQEAGLRVPDDVSVVSFDDAPLAAWLRPGLTTFALPHDELGRRAVRMLLGLIDARGAAGGEPGDPPGDPGGDTVVRLPMPLVTRGSVRGR